MKRIASTLVIGTLCAMGGVTTAHAARPAFCGGLAQNAELRDLGATLSVLGTSAQRSGDALAVARVGRLFGRAAARSSRTTRRQFQRAQADLIAVRRAGRVTTTTAVRMQSSFGLLDRKVARRCGMPVLRMARKSTAKGAARAELRFGPDPGLCTSKNDGRVRIPQDFRVDVCWDGNKLTIKNRSTVVLRIVTEGGLPTPIQGINEPPPLSSLFTASNYGKDIIPPQYTETVTAGTGGGAVRIIAADQNILTRHAIAALIQEVLPLDSGVGAYAAFQKLVTGLDGAQARATQCLVGANAFTRVKCLGIFTRDAGYEFGVAGVALGVEAGKAVPKLVGRAWSIITVSNLVSSHFKDLAKVITGAERIDIAPAAAGGGGSTTSPSTGSLPSNGAPTTPPATGPGMVTVGQGPPAPQGYRYAITLSGFPANKSVSVVCRDSADPGGFFTFTLTTNASGAASTSSQCFSADGPEHWVTADGIDSNRARWSGNTPPQAPTSAAVTVDNRVTNGGSAMREDTPAYLSTVTRNFCKRDGCMLTGTEVGSGNVVNAECTVIGDRTTNGQDNSAIDDGNPGLYSSTRWYGVRWGDGRFGYISEVWIRSADRGGKGLGSC